MQFQQFRRCLKAAPTSGNIWGLRNNSKRPEDFRYLRPVMQTPAGIFQSCSFPSPSFDSVLLWLSTVSLEVAPLK
jgi:hypothetical protein